MKRFRWDKKYLHWGVTAFCVIAGAIALYMLLTHLTGLRSAMQQLVRILSPFVWGLVIAYLIFPLQKIYQKHLFTPLAKRLYRKSAKAETAVPKFAQGMSVLLAEISLLVILAGLIWAVGPQLYNSVESIVVNSQSYIEKADKLISRFLTDFPQIESAVSTAVGDLSDGFVNLATKYLLPEISGVISNVTSSVFNLAKGIYNILIGIIVSVYVLGSREVFAAHGKKLLYAIFSLEASEKILNALHFTNDVFMGFLSGKILDSTIIGIMCYIGCLIMKTPYGVLCSFIVGVTNIIPFFGPLFGMIPTTFIILIEDPLKAVIFLAFVLLLQQFDGNFLGPKILGNSVGIGGFWVLFSIIVGSGLFGFMGMLLGVPVFVVIYTFFKNLVNRKLERSGLAVSTEEYKNLDHIDPKTGEMVWLHTAVRRKNKSRKKKKSEAAQSAASDEEDTEEPSEPDGDAEEQEADAAQR